MFINKQSNITEFKSKFEKDKTKTNLIFNEESNFIKIFNNLFTSFDTIKCKVLKEILLLIIHILYWIKFVGF